LSDEDEYVPGDALQALVRVGKDKSEEVIPALMDTVKKASPAVVEAIRDIGDFGPKAADAVPFLIGLLQNAIGLKEEKAYGFSFGSVRGSAASALGQIGPAAKDAVPVLLKQLQSEEDYSYKQSIIFALARIGYAGDDFISYLIDALDSDNLDLSRVAIETSGILGKPAKKITPYLVKMLGHSNLGHFNNRAIESIGLIGENSPGAILRLRMLLDFDSVAPEVNFALYKLGDEPEKRLDTLIKLLDSPDGRTRMVAARMLSYIGPPAIEAIPKIKHIPLMVEDWMTQDRLNGYIAKIEGNGEGD